MEQRELAWDTDASPEKLAEIVQLVAREFGIQFGLETDIKRIPGSQHWHLRRERQPGVLEVTLVARTQSGFVSVHANRRANWIDEGLEPFAARLQNLLCSEGLP